MLRARLLLGYAGPATSAAAVPWAEPMPAPRLAPPTAEACPRRAGPRSGRRLRSSSRSSASTPALPGPRYRPPWHRRRPGRSSFVTGVERARRRDGVAGRATRSGSSQRSGHDQDRVERGSTRRRRGAPDRRGRRTDRIVDRPDRRACLPSRRHRARGPPTRSRPVRSTGWRAGTAFDVDRENADGGAHVTLTAIQHERRLTGPALKAKRSTRAAGPTPTLGGDEPADRDPACGGGNALQRSVARGERPNRSGARLSARDARAGSTSTGAGQSRRGPRERLGVRARCHLRCDDPARCRPTEPSDVPSPRLSDWPIRHRVEPGPTSTPTSPPTPRPTPKARTPKPTTPKPTPGPTPNPTPDADAQHRRRSIGPLVAHRDVLPRWGHPRLGAFERWRLPPLPRPAGSKSSTIPTTYPPQGGACGRGRHVLHGSRDDGRLRSHQERGGATAYYRAIAFDEGEQALAASAVRASRRCASSGSARWRSPSKGRRPPSAGSRMPGPAGCYTTYKLAYSAEGLDPELRRWGTRSPGPAASRRRARCFCRRPRAWDLLVPAAGDPGHVPRQFRRRPDQRRSLHGAVGRDCGPVARGRVLLPAEARRPLLDERRDPLGVIGGRAGDPLEPGLVFECRPRGSTRRPERGRAS